MRTVLTALALILRFYSISQDVFDAARSGDIVLLDKLYQLNSDTLKSENSNGFSPLILACYYNQEAAVQFLIDKNVDVNQTSQEGTALLGASYKGNLAIITLLLNAGADVNATSKDGTSPLIFAVLAKNAEVVTLLLSFNADVEHADTKGLTALDYAKRLDCSEVVQLLNQ
jgi:ankyrin repeat protein